jgi:hypothetical protein
VAEWLGRGPQDLLQWFESIPNLFFAPGAKRPAHNQGQVAEWLGRGLQNLVRRFESAPDLSFFSLFTSLLSKLPVFTAGFKAFVKRSELAVIWKMGWIW